MISISDLDNLHLLLLNSPQIFGRVFDQIFGQGFWLGFWGGNNPYMQFYSTARTKEKAVESTFLCLFIIILLLRANFTNRGLGHPGEGRGSPRPAHHALALATKNQGNPTKQKARTNVENFIFPRGRPFLCFVETFRTQGCGRYEKHNRSVPIKYILRYPNHFLTDTVGRRMVGCW